MTRILYLLLSNGRLTGGQKMIFRHVETLNELGFDAAVILGQESAAPAGLQHRAPILGAIVPRSDDIVVVGDDAPQALQLNNVVSWRTVVFAQSGYALPAVGADLIDQRPKDRPLVFIAVSEATAARTRRVYPNAQIEIVPCFADERLFRPGPDRRMAIVHTPDKRPFEAMAIRGLFRRLHKRHAEIEWISLRHVPEPIVADVFGSVSLCLSLNRLESVGLTTLEAMASGCICAGFLGGGGTQYGTADNGFWVPDEDCEAAADALAAAADLALEDGPDFARMQDSARAAAARWSYARFRDRLEEVWMRLAPEARH